MTLKLNQIIAKIDGKIFHCSVSLGIEVERAWAADLMSDVLASPTSGALLITALCSPQMVRTAEMMDMIAIVLVGGKKPDDSVVNLVKDLDIPLILTNKSLYETCGILYYCGIKGA